VPLALAGEMGLCVYNGMPDMVDMLLSFGEVKLAGCMWEELWTMGWINCHLKVEETHHSR